MIGAALLASEARRKCERAAGEGDFVEMQRQMVKVHRLSAKAVDWLLTRIMPRQQAVRRIVSHRAPRPAARRRRSTHRTSRPTARGSGPGGEAGEPPSTADLARRLLRILEAKTSGPFDRPVSRALDVLLEVM